MKKLIVIFLLCCSVIFPQSNFVYQDDRIEVTRACIVCGQEWEDFEKSNISYWGGTSIGLYDYNKPRGAKWYVYLHDNAYLCNHCWDKYAENWQSAMKTGFNLMLSSAIENEKDYAMKVRTNIKIKKLKELEEKLDELKKVIDEVKK